MSKITTSTLEEQLISVWKEGWPEYYIQSCDDYPAVLALVHQIANYLNVEPSHVEGHERCCNALRTIATYCRNHMPWAAKNIHFYNRAFQTLRNEMSAKKRMQSMQNGTYNYKKE